MGLQTAANACTIIASVATCFAAYVAYVVVRQLRQAAWLKAQEQWMNPAFLAAREKLFHFIANVESDSGLTKADCYLICRNLDGFSLLARHFTFADHLGSDEVLDVWSDPIGKSWVLLEGFVELERGNSSWTAKWKARKDIGILAYPRLSAPMRDKLELAAKQLNPQFEKMINRQLPVNFRPCR